MLQQTSGPPGRLPIKKLHRLRISIGGRTNLEGIPRQKPILIAQQIKVSRHGLWLVFGGMLMAFQGR